MAGLAAELRREAESRGVTLRLVAERPPEWRLGALTVVIDAGRNSATLRYARNLVARAPCDAGEVMAAWERALARLASDSIEPERFGEALAAGYAAARAAEGQERVELVALWEEVARAPGRRRYTRAQFAWDLARLRRERGLDLPAGRIALDVATGRPSARLRFWIEDERGTGQYYRFFRLIRR